MEKGSILRDILILIGILQIPPQPKIKQHDQVLGHQGKYLSILSQKEIEENRIDTEKMLQIIN